MKYTKTHEPGVKPPKAALDAEAWRDLEPATKGGSVFEIQEGDAKPFQIRASHHTEQVLRTLMKRPLYCGSRCRHSQYISKLRGEGVGIDTEGYRADPKTGRETYGVWFLRSRVTEVQE